MKVLATEDQKQLLQTGTIVVDKDGNKWHYLPYWFKHIEGNLFQLYSPENLPEEFRKQLEAQRHETH